MRYSSPPLGATAWPSPVRSYKSVRNARARVTEKKTLCIPLSARDTESDVHLKPRSGVHLKPRAYPQDFASKTTCLFTYPQMKTHLKPRAYPQDRMHVKPRYNLLTHACETTIVMHVKPREERFVYERVR